MRGSDLGCHQAALPFLEKHRRAVWTAALLASLALLFVVTTSASALTFGMNWRGNYSTADLESAKKSGATVYHLPINYSDTNGGNWGSVDSIVEAAWTRGVTIMPTLIRTNGQGNRFLLPADPDWNSWGAWSQEVVERYGINGSFWNGKANPTPITAWEVWNEPNFIVNNPFTTEKACKNQGQNYVPTEGTCIQPQRYGSFLAYTAKKIQAGSFNKTAHGTNALFGGIFMSAGENYEAFLEKAAASGGLSGDVTGVAIHPYSFQYGKSLLEEQVNDTRTKLNSLGAGGKTLWLTEFGWPTGGTKGFPAGMEYKSEAVQAGILGEAMDWIKANANAKQIELAAYFTVKDYDAEGGWAGYCGLIGFSGEYRPAWYVFQEETGATRWPVAPVVATSSATGVGNGEVTLNGTVNPRGLPTTYRFEYGNTTSYGNAIPVPDGSAGEGEGAVSESAVITGLQPGAPYHYRIVATNSIGTSYGADIEFTTPSPTSAWALTSGSNLTNPNQWVYYRGENGQIWQWNWFGSIWSNAQATTQAAATGTTPTAIAHGGAVGNPQQFVYYHGSDNNIWQWYWSGFGSTNGALAGGQPVAANTSPTALASGSNLNNPNQWVYYTGANGQIWQWNWFGSIWSNAQATTQAAAAGTSPTAFASGGTASNPRQWVYYHGSDNNIWQWFWSGSGSTNGALAGGQPVAANTSPTALASGSNLNNPNQWVYYTGANGQIWQWNWFGGGWSNAQATTHAAAAGTSPTAFASGGTVDNPRQWVYYIGSDGNIWQWFWSGFGSTNNVLAGGEPADPSVTPTVVASGGAGPNNPNQWIYYRGVDGQIWQWYWDGSSWTNAPV